MHCEGSHITCRAQWKATASEPSSYWKEQTSLVTYKKLLQKCVASQGMEPVWLLTSQANDATFGSLFLPPSIQLDAQFYLGLGMIGNTARV